MAGKPENVSNLDQERTKKFLNRLAQDPFIAIVVTEDDEVRIFGKGIEPEHIDRIREVLSEIQRED